MKSIVSYEKTFLYHLGYKISYSVKSSRIIFHNINEFFEDHDGVAHLTLIPTEEKYKGVLIKYEELFDKTKYVIKAKNNNWGHCDEKGWTFGMNSSDDLPLERRSLMYNVVALVRFVLEDESKHYRQVFLQGSLYKH